MAQFKLVDLFPSVTDVVTADSVVESRLDHYAELAKHLYSVRPLEQHQRATRRYIAGIHMFIDSFSSDPAFNLKDFLSHACLQMHGDGSITLLPF